MHYLYSVAFCLQDVPVAQLHEAEDAVKEELTGGFVCLISMFGQVVDGYYNSTV